MMQEKRLKLSWCCYRYAILGSVRLPSCHHGRNTCIWRFFIHNYWCRFLFRRGRVPAATRFAGGHGIEALKDQKV